MTYKIHKLKTILAKHVPWTWRELDRPINVGDQHELYAVPGDRNRDDAMFYVIVSPDIEYAQIAGHMWGSDREAMVGDTLEERADSVRALIDDNLEDIRDEARGFIELADDVGWSLHP